MGTWFGAAGLVVLGWVEGQVTEEFAVTVDDPDVQVVGEDVDADAGQEAAEPDVVQAAVVAQGDRSGWVDHIAAEPVVVGDRRAVRGGAGACRVGLGGGASITTPLPSVVAVILGRVVVACTYGVPLCSVVPGPSASPESQAAQALPYVQGVCRHTMIRSLLQHPG